MISVLLRCFLFPGSCPETSPGTSQCASVMGSEDAGNCRILTFLMFLTVLVDPCSPETDARYCPDRGCAMDKSMHPINGAILRECKWGGCEVDDMK